ncbi:MAG: oligosaccharide flippase family protein [Lautropia sp.]|nr:oligosaccharide flippase family protein [Lautropia sp.]
MNNPAPHQPSYIRTVLKVLTGSATAQAIPLLVMLLLARMVSVEALGVYAIWQSVIYIAIVPATARMEVLLVALPLASDRRKAFHIGVFTSITISALLSIVAILAQPLITARLPGWHLPASILVGLGTWALAMQTLWLSMAVTTGSFGVVNHIRITSAGLTALLQVALVAFWPNSMMLMLGFVVGTSMGSWAAWVGLKSFLMAHDLPDPGGRHQPCQSYGELMRTHGRTPMIALPAALINTIAQQIPLLLTGARFNAHAAGLLGTAWRTISAPMSIISSSAQDVFKNKAAEEFNRTGQCRSAYLQTLRLLAFLGIFPSVALLFWGPALFALVFGESFRAAGEIAQVFAPLLFIRFFASPLGYTLLIVRQAKLDLYWQIGLLTMSIVAFTVPQQAMTAFVWFSAGYTALYVVYLLLQWRAAGGNGSLTTPPGA